MRDHSPAAEISAAAALMRQRTEAATPGPWHTRFVPAKPGLNVSEAFDRHFVCSNTINVAQADEPDAAYVASMQPVVALAVADWLDRFGDRTYCYGPAEFDCALAIARAYLGETDD